MWDYVVSCVWKFGSVLRDSLAWGVGAGYGRGMTTVAGGSFPGASASATCAPGRSRHGRRGSGRRGASAGLVVPVEPVAIGSVGARSAGVSSTVWHATGRSRGS